MSAISSTGCFENIVCGNDSIELLEHLHGTNSFSPEPGGGERFGFVTDQRRPASDLSGFVYAALLRAALHSMDSGLRQVSQLLHQFHPARFVPRDGAGDFGGPA